MQFRTLCFGLFLAASALACQTAPAKDPAPAPAPSASNSTAHAPRRSLPKPEHLSEDVRDAIASKMREHGDDMTVLLWSILFLDLDGSGEYAKAMIERSPIPEKVEGHEVSRQLLDLQLELRAKAESIVALSAVKGAKDPQRFATAFGEVTRVCVACHAAYLYPGRDSIPEGK